VVDEVEISSVEVAVPPRVSVAGVRDMVSPAGELDAARLTVPVKPLMLVAVRVDDTAEPCVTMSRTGLAESVKSGGGGVATITEIVTECDRVPLVPVIVTV
jgi:hypothetical protein